MKLEYIPHLVISAYLKEKRFQKFASAAISFDLVGFTSMCEALLPLGRIGEETLANELESLFAPMVKTIESLGGMITDYAGDAFVALFPVKRGISAENATYLAMRAGQECLEWLDTNRFRTTPAGTFSITARAGIAFGSAEFHIVEYQPEQGHSGMGRLGFYFCGDAIERASIAQSESAHGQMKIFENNPLPEECASSKKARQTPLSETDLKRFLPNVIVEHIPRGEARRVVSVYGRFSSALDGDLREQAFSIMAQGEAAFDGYFSGLHFDSKGWGFLVIFGAPVAHEDDVYRALEFSTFVREKMKCKFGIEIQIGVNIGEAYAGLTGGAGRVKYTCLGDAINLSERISEIGSAGKVLCSESVMKSAYKYDIQNAGEHEIKGKSAPIKVFEILGRKALETGMPFEGKFCGRRSELSQLRNLVEPIFSGKRFAGVARITGIPGTGKSRLLCELRKSLESQGRQFCWVYLPCDPISKNPFNPLLYFLKARFPFNEFDDRESWKSRFQWAFEQYARNPKILDENRDELLRTISVIGGYLGYRWEGSLYEALDARGRKENVLYAMKALIKANSDIAPTVVEIEDAHWLDAETESWLEILTRNVDDVPFIILTTERPDESGNVRKIKWSQGTPEHFISLGNLTEKGLREMIASELGAQPDEFLFKYLHQRTDGNPFFAEQFCKYFLDKQAVMERDGEMHLIFAPEILPPDAETMLVARIDAMGAKIKDLLQRASILGIRFALNILEKMLESGNELPAMLSDAEQKGAILPEDAMELSELYYLFRHALLQEAAYGTQLPGARAKLHKLALELYEAAYSQEEHRKPYYVDMSRHAEKAGDRTKFIEYLEKAANQAKDIYNNQQAMELYDKLLANVDDENAKLKINHNKISVLILIGMWDKAEECSKILLKSSTELNNKSMIAYSNDLLGQIFSMRGLYKDALSYFEDAYKLFSSLGDQRCTHSIMCSIALTHSGQGEYAKALEYLQQLLEFAESTNDNKITTRALCTISNIFYLQRKFEEALDYLKRGIELIKQSGYKDFMCTALHNIAMTYREQGKLDDAMNHFHESLMISKEIGDKNGIGFCLGNIAGTNFYRGKFSAALDAYDEQIRIANELGNFYMLSCAYIDKGSVNFEMGQFLEAKDYFITSADIAEQIGDKNGIAHAFRAIAEAEKNLGNYAEAEEHFEKTIAVARDLQIQGFIPQTLCSKVELYIMMKRIDKAKALIDTLQKEAEADADNSILAQTNILLSNIHILDNEVEKAIDLLKKTLPIAHGTEEEAFVHYELWKALPSDSDEKQAHKKQAFSSLSELYEMRPSFQYKNKIDEMM